MKNIFPNQGRGRIFWPEKQNLKKKALFTIAKFRIFTENFIKQFSEDEKKSSVAKFGRGVLVYLVSRYF